MDTGHKSSRQPNPREDANPFSAAFFCYTFPTFFKGYKRDLEQTDLTETLSEHKSNKLGNKIEAAWDDEIIKAKRSNRKPSLRRVLMRVFGWEFMFYGLVLAFTEFAIKIHQPIMLGKLVRFFTPMDKRFSGRHVKIGEEITNGADVDINEPTVPQPILLGQLIRFYSPGQSDISLDEAYLYAGGVVLCSLITVFIVHPYMMGILHLGMKMRIACCSLVYRKALRLSQKALGNTTAGNLVNLLSNDVNRFDVALIFAHQLWVGPLETAIVTYLMYLQIGISAVYGVIIILLFVPLQIYLGKRVSILRLRTALRTDERVRLMNEIISGIQVIKMYTWEKPFAYLVDLARRYEISSIRGTSYIRVILVSFIIFATRISIFSSILAYVLAGFQITAEQVFVITSFHNVLRQTMTIFFPQGVAQIAEVNVSINRLNKFLNFEENELLIDFQKKNDNQHVNNHSDMGAFKEADDEEHLVSTETKNVGIKIENVVAKWSEQSTENTLSNISIEVKPGRLVAVIGPVGAGKSSLLHAILKELPIQGGNIYVTGELSYACQEPWLFAGTVRQNILFGQPYDKLRYRNVVKKCALERDFELFSHGDRTRVGERGVSLSGGQRARINLARAVYKQADIYLLDDPLSAVDTHVGKQLFENCITGFLRDKCVILVTHQLQYLKEVDQIVIIENGKLKGQGTYRQLQESGVDFAKMLVEEPVEEEEIEKKPVLDRRSSVKSLQSNDEKTLEEAPEVQEQKSSGSVGSYVYLQYFKAGGNICIVFTLLSLFVLTQLSASGADYFITYWVNLEQSRYDGTSSSSSSLTKISEDITTTIAPILSNFSNNFNGTQKDAVPAEDSFWNFDRDVCIYIYSAITGLTVILTLLRSYMFVNNAMRASTNLHDMMFRSITRAKMYFFNTNSSGRILNRFSKDMGSIDELLPGAMVDVLQIGLTLAGIIVVVAIVNPWLLIPTVISGIIFYYIRNFYITTSRSIKRLEGVTRSPVFYHINASINGLTTIRAFKAQSVLEKEFDNHQDLHSSAWFSFLSTSRAFGFWLDIVCVIYIAIVTLSFLVLGNEKFGGNVGLAITQSIGLTGMFQWGMRQSAELENQMTSVERVLEYTSIDQEPALESSADKKPRESWPEKGEIQFKDLYLSYGEGEPPVLKNLNFLVKPKEKVGIVGRTGAGKSSLISALFRLTDIRGKIIIDNVITNDIGLHDLRSKISIIPQEPVLFSGTMRKNLDPFDDYNDEVLWKALEDVELKDAVMDLTAGLNSKMSEGGSNFSVGQRQLVCLARAIIRNNKVLVLDEATANVDPQTDGLIQTTIRKKFSECTVLTIAHRLHTVMDSDKVLVMDAGQMVEFDHPHILLQNKNGTLYGMVQQTGKSMADALMRIAQESYEKQQKYK